MAKQKKAIEAPDSLQVIARLLALIAIKGTDKDEAALQLSSTGLDDNVVADILGVSESYIRVVRFRKKKKK